ncbi:hypothetical protein ACSBR2_018789 [Camellia fascicularis]
MIVALVSALHRAILRTLPALVSALHCAILCTLPVLVSALHRAILRTLPALVNALYRTILRTLPALVSALHRAILCTLLALVSALIALFCALYLHLFVHFIALSCAPALHCLVHLYRTILCIHSCIALFCAFTLHRTILCILFAGLCKYSNSYTAIKISEGYSYHKVVEKISAKFKELIVGCSGSHVVDVVVGDKRIVEVDDYSSRIDFVICESSLVNDCDDFGTLLPSFYLEPERVLLSASWKGIIHSVGQEFEGGVSAFYIALAKYAVECGFAVNYLKNDASRVTAECMMKLSMGCKWFVHGRVLMNFGIFFIMKLDNVHTCGVVARRSCSKIVGSSLVSDIVHNDISDNPLTRPIDVKKKLKKQYGIDISYRVA